MIDHDHPTLTPEQRHLVREIAAILRAAPVPRPVPVAAILRAAVLRAADHDELDAAQEADR